MNAASDRFCCGFHRFNKATRRDRSIKIDANKAREHGVSDGRSFGLVNFARRSSQPASNQEIEMEGPALSPSLEAALSSVLQRIEGTEHVIVSNPFGLPIARVSLEDESQITIDPRPIETTLAIVLAKTSEAADKLPLGKCKTVTTLASSFVLVQASMPPLIVAVVAKPTVDPAAIISLMPSLVATLEPLRAALEAEMNG